MARLNPGRLAAARALVNVEKGRHADQEMQRLAPSAGADRALCWHLVLGVLRRRGNLDYEIAGHLARGGVEDLDPPVLIALRVGLFEIRHCNTPAHAAVDQAVQLCRATRGGRGAGLVNAVLRRLAKAEMSNDPWRDLPPWLGERWRDHPDWVESLSQPAPVHGVWNGSRRSGLACEPIDEARGTFSVATGGRRVENLPGFEAGDWWVMDAGSVRCADAVHDALGRRGHVLDCCAAPGGKSMRLASLGHTVRATDADSGRLELLREAAVRLGLAVESSVHDWEKGASDELGQFDAVLVDAPCTGLGTIRRRPEIRWKVLESDPAAMAIRQGRILVNAARHVRAGGWLVYSVCSPIEEEGGAVIDALEGYELVDSWCNLGSSRLEDVFQCFVLSNQR